MYMCMLVCVGAYVAFGILIVYMDHDYFMVNDC